MSTLPISFLGIVTLLYAYVQNRWLQILMLQGSRLHNLALQSGASVDTETASDGSGGWLDALRAFFAEYSWVVVTITVVTFVGSLILLRFVMARIPNDYFLPPEMRNVQPARTPMQLLLLVLRNLFGGILLLAGIAMLVLPGQGLLTMIVGLSLIDFPGRHNVLSKLTRQVRIRRALQFLREKAGGDRLLFEDDNLDIDAAEDRAEAERSKDDAP